jgi:hypothetical protein
MIEHEPASPNEVEIPVYVGEEIVFMTPPEYYGWLGNIALRCTEKEPESAE